MKPTTAEYAPYYDKYISLMADEGLTEILEKQVQELDELFSLLNDEQALFRYAPGKWSLKEVLGHITDGERIFGFRALAVSRGDKTALPGFDENLYVEQAGFDSRSIDSLLFEWLYLRKANLALYRTLTESQLNQAGTANQQPVSARALFYILGGHAKHHMQVIRERYLPAMGIHSI